MFGLDFTDGRQQDSIAFLHYLLASEGGLNGLFQFEAREVYTCSRCGEVTVRIVAKTELSLHRPLRSEDGGHRLSWDELLRGSLTGEVEKRCYSGRCPPGLDVLHSLAVTVQLGASTRLLLVRINRHVGQTGPDGRQLISPQGRQLFHESKVAVNGFKAADVRLPGLPRTVTLNTLAAVTHIGESVQHGHYAAVTRLPAASGWLRKSDTTCAPLAKFPPSLHGVYYLLLEVKRA
jgi:hypothetical protein